MAPPPEASGSAAKKASWKLDASLDEVIEADLDEQWESGGGGGGRASGSGKSKGRGYSKGWKGQVEVANYWDVESGWTYRPPQPPPSRGKGGPGWIEDRWPDEWGYGDSWKGKGKSYGKGGRRDEGGWWDSSYDSGRQQASASNSWASTGTGWSSSSRWTGVGWQTKAEGSGWTDGGGSSADGGWSQGGASWKGWNGGGSSSSQPGSGGKGGSGWSGGGGGCGALRSEPELDSSARYATRTDSAVGHSAAASRTAASASYGGVGHQSGVDYDVYAGAPARKHRLDHVQAVAEPPPREWKRVKVTNIPDKLPKQDIRDAFEAATGRILQFEMDRGTALITFSDPRSAVKAADTFDRGELNGNIIDVKVVP